MRVYSTYKSKEFAKGVARHFLESLSYAHQDVWLISPWVKDVRLPIRELGHFSSVLGGHFDEITLSSLLERVIERHTLHIITKPPEELVDLRKFVLLREKLAQYKALAGDDAYRGLAIISRVASTLLSEIDQLITDLRTHETTYNFGKRLEQQGAKTYYLPRLHAKVSWSPTSAFIGSANYTNGGFFYNDELVLEVTDSKAHQAILDQVRTMTRRAVPRSDYDLASALKRSGFEDEIDFLELAADPLFDEHADLKAFMEELSYLVR